MLLFGTITSKAGGQGTMVQPAKPVEKAIKLETGITMQYVEQGNRNGTPVILVHGFTDSWHSFASTMTFLPEHLHVYALTMRGHGNSTKPEAGYHPRDFAADIACFIREMKLGRAVIVGHSMGGVIAQQFALDYPMLSSALVIVDSDAAFKENADLGTFLNEVSQLTDPVSHEFADAFQRSTLSNPIDTLYYGELVNETLKVPARVWKAVMNAMNEVDYTKTTLKDFRKPVIIFWGDRDFITPFKAQERLRKVFPHAELNVYAETGHALHWERPGQFAKDLAAFVDKLSPPTTINRGQPALIFFRYLDV